MAYQIRQEMCSCCHQCKIACPAKAIHFKNAKYWIDSSRCISCGKCASLCHNCCIYNMDEPDTEPEKHETRYRKCDLVVCGSGASGLISAVRTAQSGKKVVVLEKAGKPGGNSWYAGANHFIYTRYHKEAGIPDFRDDKVREFMMKTCWQVDVQLINHLYQTSDKIVDWLLDDCECSDDLYPVRAGESDFFFGFANKTIDLDQFPHPDRSIGPGGFGTFVVLKMLSLCEKLGVDVLTEHEAVELKTDPDGRISGVVAKDPGGCVEFECPTVVLATGCFSHNEELLKIANPDLFLPGDPVHYFSVPTCTGDGIKMAKAIGGKIDYKNMRALSLGPAHHPFGYSSLCISRLPYVININLDGKRWIAEENGMAHAHKFLEQPRLVSYAVCDQNIVEKSIQELLDTGYDGEQGAAIFKGYKEELEEEASLDIPTKKADTLEDLAELMGVPVDTFLAEVERYNTFCRKGHDDDFLKSPSALIPIETPPFYAFYEKRFQENAMGGMAIDYKTRVLKDDDTGYIPGLFAVGDNTRGIQVAGDISPMYIERECTALTWATSSGYMASEGVLEYLDELKQ